jgi:hypothetical protein
MVQNCVPQIGDVVVAYSIKHPFTVVQVLKRINAVKLKYPDGSLTRLIPLSAIELVGERPAGKQMSVRKHAHDYPKN